MTEQSKIPVPPGQGEGANEGRSLLERASGAFELGGFGGTGFKPAPVPKDLAAAPKRAVRAAPAAQPAQAAPIAPPPQPVAEATGAQFTPAALQSPVAPPPAAPVEPVHFSGIKHVVDRAHLREQGLIEPEGGVTALLEEFRIVKRALLQAMRDAQDRGLSSTATQRVLICSPLPGEGKTFCATNLAIAIAAEKDSEVLLVDADFAKPSILSTLGLPGGAGLMDALADPSIRVEDCVLGTDIPGLWVLPAGNQTTSDSEFLASHRTAQVLDRLTQGAANRVVIFDSPPALAASPAAELAKHVGQAVLVARADSTGQNAIEDALQLLSGCADIKLLLNAALFSPSGRRFGSYYGYGG